LKVGFKLFGVMCWSWFCSYDGFGNGREEDEEEEEVEEEEWRELCMYLRIRVLVVKTLVSVSDKSNVSKGFVCVMLR